MKEIYYYERDENNHPVRTFCIIEAGGKLAKGISICSAKDQPQKKKGRLIAKARALESMLTESNRVSQAGNYLLAETIDYNAWPDRLSSFEKGLLKKNGMIY